MIAPYVILCHLMFSDISDLYRTLYTPGFILAILNYRNTIFNEVVIVLTWIKT